MELDISLSFLSIFNRVVFHFKKMFFSYLDRSIALFFFTLNKSFKHSQSLLEKHVNLSSNVNESKLIVKILYFK